MEPPKNFMVGTIHSFRMRSLAASLTHARRRDPKISTLVSFVNKLFPHCSSVRLTCSLTNLNRLITFAYRSKGFFQATRPFKPTLFRRCRRTEEMWWCEYPFFLKVTALACSVVLQQTNHDFQPLHLH